MSSLLEITGDDIALLGDADLRSLIGLLCEADFRLAGLPTNGIIWGGHQDASDDGMDVTVNCDFEPSQNSRVPRMVTGFQVKVPDMQPAKIGKEMKPKGKLREEIKALIVESGAYIIVNSKGSVTEKALRMRLKAMREAVASESNYQQIHLDFLDRDRIATWVRTHPSLILWVRNKIGRPLQGWQPYGNWANTPTGLQEEFIVDEELRLYDGTNSKQGDSVINGLRKLRLRLSQNGVSIRLTGLSGVGKTRLVQALFDERVGDNVLNQFLAYYTDISDNPLPDPPTFASQLIATNEKAVLIIDNCSPELHRSLTKLCKGTMVNLLTIEYDIRDDLPEETGVFRLEQASDKLIEKLLKHRYPYISQINAQTIAEFANGNARVAIALANTLEQDESLSTLRDEELFNRLFHQRHHPNEYLRVSAEICSLVYSFDGVNSKETSELIFLANLADKSVRELYRDVAELRNRGLVQARSVWRAVLPHAIANRLAKDALNSIPTQTVVDAFLSSDLERLIGSFTRRLSYLHDCEPAIEIAKELLKSDGWIGKTNCNLNTLERTVFENIAPIAPEAALQMLERSSNASEGFERLRRHEFVRLLRHLAYEPDLFQRSTRLLSKIALLEQPNTNDGSSARRTLSTLFHIFLSGTDAPAQIRVTIIDELLNSSNKVEQELGIDLLEAALETHHFMTTHTNAFGARPRDFGYRPATNQEMVNWYRIFLAICTQAALSDKTVAIKAKQVMANQLRGLWSIGERFDQEFLGDLEQAVIQIHSKETWNEGWISIKGIIHYDAKQMDKAFLTKLKKLSERLKPVTLFDQARTYALSDNRLNFQLEESFDEEINFSDNWTKVRELTRKIGAKVAQDDTIFTKLLPELVSTYHDRLSVFGEGLADGSKDRKKMWGTLYQQLEKTPQEKRQITVLLGFLSSCATQDSALYNLILDSLIEDPLLGQWFPYFQMTSKIDKQSLKRLHEALDKGNPNIFGFKQLTWGGRHEAIEDDDLASLMQKLIEKKGGAEVAIDILSMRFHKEKGEQLIISKKLAETSRTILIDYFHDEEESTRNDRLDYELSKIAGATLRGEEAALSAEKLCEFLAEEFSEYRIYSFRYPRLLEKLARVQPYIFLNSFIGCDEYMFRQRTFGDLERADSPVNHIPENILVGWCEEDPTARYPLIVSSLQTYSKSKDSEELYWEPIVFSIFEKSPNIKAVLSQLESEIYPMSWSGSRAEGMAKRLPLLEKLFKHSNSVVREWAIEQHQKLQIEVENQRAFELKKNQERFERFE